jgi:hypothetical protein
LALAVTVAIAAFLIQHIAVTDAICTGTRTAFLAGHTSLAVFFFHFHLSIFEIINIIRCLIGVGSLSAQIFRYF